MVKRLAILFLFASVASAQVTRYAGPNGSTTNTGLTWNSPWTLAKAIDTVNTYGGTLYLEDSVMTIANWPTVTYIGNTSDLPVKIMADTLRHARPFITSVNNFPPRITFRKYVYCYGISFGGVRDTINWDIGAVMQGDSYDTLVNCTLWGFTNDGFDALNTATNVLVKNNLIVNVGLYPYQHGMYWTSYAATDASQTSTIHRNVFVAKHGAAGDSATWFGAAIQTYHGPTYMAISKNFVSYTDGMWNIGAQTWAEKYAYGDVTPPTDSTGDWVVKEWRDTANCSTRDHNYTIRDNVFWSSEVQPSYACGGWPDSNAKGPDSVSHLHNLYGKFVPYAQWGPGRGAHSDSNYYEVSGQEDMPNDSYNPHWHYDQAATYVGVDSATVDTAVARLARSFGHRKTVAQIYADTSIIRNWRTLLSTVDTWQGTTEEAIYYGEGARDTTVWYFSNSGDDAADGHSPDSAKQHLSERPATVHAGETFYLNRGDTFRENLTFAGSGTAGSPITIDAYGTGAKPLLLGSTSKSTTDDWTDNGGNVWRTGGFSASQYVGNLIFNGRTSCGVWEDSLSHVTAQGRFYYNSTVDSVYLYSVGNPATFYSDIECALDILPNGSSRNDLIDVNAQNYITIRNLNFQCAATLGVMIRGASSHITVENCNFKWIGGSLWNTVRQGDGVSIYLSNVTTTDITVRYCTFSQIFDGGPNIQLTRSTSVARRMHFYYNLIDSTNFGLYMFSDSAGAIIDSIFWENNTCVDQGRGWSLSQRGANHDSLINSGISAPFSLLGTVTNFYIRNNIVSNPYWSPTAPADYKHRQGALVFSYNVPDTNCQHITVNYNRWNCPTGTEVFYRAYGTPIDGVSNGAVYTQAQFATWQAAHSKDANSTVGDPGFVSATDFRLKSSSVARNGGLDVGYALDIEGNPVVGPPDIGAYEYQSIGTVKLRVRHKTK